LTLLHQRLRQRHDVKVKADGWLDLDIASRSNLAADHMTDPQPSQGAFHMNTTFILDALGAWFTRQLCQWREARRLQRDLAQLSAMGSHELADLGISHALVAATAQRESCCA
jgi:uncharacterized protein YjiS (DUF1127 family)